MPARFPPPRSIRGTSAEKQELAGRAIRYPDVKLIITRTAIMLALTLAGVSLACAQGPSAKQKPCAEPGDSSSDVSRFAISLRLSLIPTDNADPLSTWRRFAADAAHTPARRRLVKTATIRGASCHAPVVSAISEHRLNELTSRRYLAPAKRSDNNSSRSRHRHDASNDDAGDDNTLAQSY